MQELFRQFDCKEHAKSVACCGKIGMLMSLISQLVNILSTCLILQGYISLHFKVTSQLVTKGLSHDDL